MLLDLQICRSQSNQMGSLTSDQLEKTSKCRLQTVFSSFNFFHIFEFVFGVIDVPASNLKCNANVMPPLTLPRYYQNSLIIQANVGRRLYFKFQFLPHNIKGFKFGLIDVAARQQTPIKNLKQNSFFIQVALGMQTSHSKFHAIWT